jgi:hypothetical protein
MPRYRVLLPYTEPSFSVRLGRSKDYLYPGEMTVEADDEAEAIERAIRWFPRRSRYRPISSRSSGESPAGLITMLRSG